MTSPQKDLRVAPLSALMAAVVLWSQPGCNQQAPATEPEQRIEAQKRRAETLKAEGRTDLSAKHHRTVRRR